MRPFKDKGWPFCSKFQDMLPEPGAKGHSVFVPTLAMAPLTKENDNSDDVALPVTHMGPVIVNNSANSNQHGNGDNISIDNDSTTRTYVPRRAPARRGSHLHKVLEVRPPLRGMPLPRPIVRSLRWSPSHGPPSSLRCMLQSSAQGKSAPCGHRWWQPVPPRSALRELWSRPQVQRHEVRILEAPL
jgi:hypothetical protein